MLPNTAPIKLWEHQERAVGFAEHLLGSGYDGFGWSMGLRAGKTISALEFIRRNGLRYILVIAPISAGLDSWKREVSERLPFFEDNTVDAIAGLTSKRSKLIKEAFDKSRSDYVNKLFVIMNYEGLKGLKDTLSEIYFDLVILDESHEAKNALSKTAKYLYRMKQDRVFKYIALLTGTLLPTSPSDLYSPLRLLNPKEVGYRYRQFENNYVIKSAPNAYGFSYPIGFKNLDELRALKNKYFFHVETDEVLTLPERIIKNYTFEVSEDVVKHTERLIREAVELRDEYPNMMLGAKSRVSQALSGIDVKENARLDAFKKLISELPADERLVVAYQYSAERGMIRKALRPTGRRVYDVHGGTPAPIRVKYFQAWRDDPTAVLSMQIQVAESGIDLSVGNYLILYSASERGDCVSQIQGRLEKGGKTGKNYIINLICSNVKHDYKVLNNLKKKLEMSRSFAPQ